MRLVVQGLKKGLSWHPHVRVIVQTPAIITIQVGTIMRHVLCAAGIKVLVWQEVVPLDCLKVNFHILISI